jgi:hypothetical protein
MGQSTAEDILQETELLRRTQELEYVTEKTESSLCSVTNNCCSAR